VGAKRHRQINAAQDPGRMDSLDAGPFVTNERRQRRLPPAGKVSPCPAAHVFAECMTVFADLLALEQETGNPRPQSSPNRPRPAPSTPKCRPLSIGPKANSGAATAFAIESQVAWCSPASASPSANGPKRTEEFLRRLARLRHRPRQAAARKAQPACCSTSLPITSDLEAANFGWEGYSGRLPARFVLVSPRTAISLDVTVRKLLELWNKGALHFYTGGYSRYEQQKAEASRAA